MNSKYSIRLETVNGLEELEISGDNKILTYFYKNSIGFARF